MTEVINRPEVGSKWRYPDLRIGGSEVWTVRALREGRSGWAVHVLSESGHEVHWPLAAWGSTWISVDPAPTPVVVTPEMVQQITWIREIWVEQQMEPVYDGAVRSSYEANWNETYPALAAVLENYEQQNEEGK